MREIVLDTETTGLDPAQGHRLVEIGAVEVVNQIATGSVFHVLINPERDVPEDAYRVLEKDVVLSHAFAKEEVERFTYRAPGQANSYFYGYTKLLSIRKETESALGAKFNQKDFHDFILAQGLLPPDLMREAVLGEFVATAKGQAGH